ADLTVQSTGGTTEMTLKGFTPGKKYNVMVNSVVVDQKTAATDGSITFSRAYGSNDRVQTLEATSTDTFAPHVSGVAPANGATSVSVASQVRVTFNETMDQASAQAAFGLVSGTSVSGSFSWEDSGKILVFTPSQLLRYSTTYTVQVSTAAKDLAGNYLSPAFSSGFTTEQEPIVIEVPSAPLGLTAIGGAKTVSLSWAAPSDNGGASISGYKVYRGTTSNGQSSTAIAVLGNVTSYQDSGLLDGTIYYYKVAAVNSAGEGAKSSEASASTFSVPSQPGAPTAVGGYRSVTISWSAPTSNGGSAITGYRIYRGTSSSSLSLLATVGSVLSYTDSGLLDGTTYYYKVSAVNSIGEGSSSAVVSATTTCTVPGQPSNLLAAGSSDRIHLSWSAPASNGGSAVTGYNIYRGSSSGQLSLLTTLGNVLTYEDGGLPLGATYYYQVSAVNVVGEGARSSEVQGTTSVQVPSAPGSLQASASDGKVHLVWSIPTSDGGSSIIAYRIYRAIGLGAMELIAVIAPAQSYEDADLTNGITYSYQVSAINSVGEGALSTVVPATPLGAPSAPLNLQALPGNEKASLSWSSPSDLGGSAIVGYKVYRGISPSDMDLLVTLGATTSYDDLGLSNGEQLYYSVSAINAVGEGMTSTAVSCVPGYVPSAPVSLSAAPSDGKVALTWGAPLSENGHEITGYNVYRGLSSENLALLTSVSVILAYDDLAVENGKTYYYRVTAVNSMGEGSFSALASAKPATTPGSVEDLSASGGVGAVDLTWSAPASDGGDAILGYSIFRGQSAGSLSLVATATSTSFQDGNLQPATTYYYEVRASNSIGLGPAVSASASTPGVPSTPSNLDGSSTGSSISITWSAPSQDGGAPILSYRVYRGSSEDSLNLVATVSGTGYDDVGLAYGIRYFYAISAVNAVGEGGRCAYVSITTLTTSPSAPKNLSAEPSSLSIDLAWEAPDISGGSPVTSYRIYRGQAPESLVLLTETAQSAFTDADVTAGLTYHYQVSAVNAVGEGDRSSGANAKAVGLSSEPVGLKAVKGKSSVELTWSAPSDNGGGAITGYVIYRGTSPDKLSKLTTAGAVLKFTDASLPKANTAYYRIAAVNLAGEGGQSELASVALTKKPSPPKNPVVSSQDGQLLLSWEAPEEDGGSNVTSYAIYRRSADGDMVKVAVVDTTSLLDMGLANGLTYSYSIAAINAVGEGNLTEGVLGKPYGLPSSPPYLNATPYNEMVLLKWGAPANDGGDAVVGFDIYVVDGGEERYLGQVASEIDSYVCNDLTNGISYVFRVAAVNAAGQSEMCSVTGTPSASVASPVAASGNLELGNAMMLLVIAIGAIASAGLVTRRRSRAKRASPKPLQSKRVVATAKTDSARRIQAVTGRTVNAAPGQTASIARRPEDATFERTLRDLETTNRIL
ncbi:MAG: fibronectin type III domain-containing protein, partial [Methanomassiliicoccales archaeon]|nr:fibronectin type III domain-containing protein [Methanomassiliicoccales archaeon]